jgi:hypothetical protein
VRLSPASILSSSCCELRPSRRRHHKQRFQPRRAPSALRLRGWQMVSCVSCVWLLLLLTLRRSVDVPDVRGAQLVIGKMPPSMTAIALLAIRTRDGPISIECDVRGFCGQSISALGGRWFVLSPAGDQISASGGSSGTGGSGYLLARELTISMRDRLHGRSDGHRTRRFRRSHVDAQRGLACIPSRRTPRGPVRGPVRQG